MLERWNIGFKRKLSIFKFLTIVIFNMKPSSHLSKTHHSIDPLFQHSNCERSEISSSIVLDLPPVYIRMLTSKQLVRRWQWLCNECSFVSSTQASLPVIV
jgi:hypothetical protein